MISWRRPWQSVPSFAEHHEWHQLFLRAFTFEMLREDLPNSSRKPPIFVAHSVASRKTSVLALLRP